MVSWIFLAGAVWGALLTLNALRPVRQRWPWVGLSFFAGWMTTELALHHLLWQGVFTYVLLRWGALSQTAGLVALGVTVLSWFGLAWMVVSAFQDAGAFRGAIEGAVPEAGGVKTRVDWSRVILPFWIRRGAVERLRDLHYMEDGKRRHRLDIYRHRDVPEGAPVLLQIHGGAWVIGNKDQQGLPLLNHMASRGFVCVAINYALSPNATWPEHLIDCKRALKWVREHIAEYGGDPDFVIVTGGSAGGHLTAMMALTANDPAFQPGFESVDTRVNGFVPFYGVFDWTNRFGYHAEPGGLSELLERSVVKRPRSEAAAIYEAASPLSRSGEGAPPAMIVHGQKDNLAPVEEARRFVEKLRAESDEPVVYVELPGAHHAFEVFNSVRTLTAVAGVERFAKWLHGRHALE